MDSDDQTGVLQQDSDQKADELQRVKNQHKIRMKSKYESLFERNRIYTQHYIIHGESEAMKNMRCCTWRKHPEYETLQSTATTSLKPYLDQDVRRKAK